jgi:8-oxo-dGTP pyrophosphatase MutT (NUDIX family)
LLESYDETKFRKPGYRPAMNHLLELRKLVGKRPLFSPGSVVIALNDANRVLMQLRSDTRTWGFPGGSSELGDSLLETAQRELLEETGLVASNWTFVTVLSGQEFFFTYPNGDQIYNVSAVYIARGITGILCPDHECLELRWFEINDLPSDDTGPIKRWVVANLEQVLKM